MTVELQRCDVAALPLSVVPAQPPGSGAPQHGGWLGADTAACQNHRNMETTKPGKSSLQLLTRDAKAQLLLHFFQFLAQELLLVQG